MRSALFLDRDGVINIDLGYVFKPSDFIAVEGIENLSSSARRLGYELIVITNQSGIARKYYSPAHVKAFHQTIHAYFQSFGCSILDFFVCPHHPAFSGNCLCRKPATLNIEKAAALHQIDLSTSFFIGDKESDMIAGKQAGCQTLFLTDSATSPWADYHIATLGEAERIISSISA